MKILFVSAALLSSWTTHLRVVDCFILPSSNVAKGMFISRVLRDNQQNVDFEDQSFGSLSQVRYIRSRNLAGFVGREEEDITVRFAEGQRLVVVTGETGAGKSLLLRKTLELLCGGKVSSGFAVGNPNNQASFLKDQTIMSVEMELLLREPQLSATRSTIQELGLDSSTMMFGRESDEVGVLRVERRLQFQPPTTLAQKTAKPRVKSLCTVNHQPVTLKVLETLVRPLVAIVDATTASQALAKPEARMAMLDTAVSSESLTRACRARLRYRSYRDKRKELQRGLESRVLPASFSRSTEQDVELIRHWVEELDTFEKRVVRFCASLVPPMSSSQSKLALLGNELASTSWKDSCAPPGQKFSSCILERLTGFRDSMANLDKQLTSARAALELIGSLSFKQSAITSVEKARDLLLDSHSSEARDTKISRAAEHAHELLNVVEESISDFVDCVEDENRGLIRMLEQELSVCSVSKEDIDSIMLEWGTLARKHGIGAALLPSCHEALKSELSGNVEALSLLPMALADEERALFDFEDACANLSQERLLVASRLSDGVTSRLPSLGMDHARFHARVDSKARKCADPSVYAAGGTGGRDAVDFELDQAMESTPNGELQSQVHVVASSGEKARLLLSIECTLPGSVGAACGTITGTAPSSRGSTFSNIPPVVVLYDEIDAHVGGRAAVSLARMLVDQSLNSQVIAITHNPSVAASGDFHLVVKRERQDKENGAGSSVVVSVESIDGPERRKELARMASGDLASREAEIFADALIRDGSKRRERKP